MDVFLHEDLPQLSYLEPSTSQNTNSIEPITINHDSLHEEIFIKEEPEDEADLFLSNDDNFLDDTYTPMDLDLENDPAKAIVDKRSDPFKKPYAFNVEEKPRKSDIFKKPLDPDLARKAVYSNLDRKQSEGNRKPYCLYSNLDRPFYHPLDIEKPGLDHDYCQDDEILLDTTAIKKEPSSPTGSGSEYSFNEHSYCRPLDDSGETSKGKPEPIEEIVCDIRQPDENKLRFGLDESYFSNGSSESKVCIQYAIERFSSCVCFFKCRYL